MGNIYNNCEGKLSVLRVHRRVHTAVLIESEATAP